MKKIIAISAFSCVLGAPLWAESAAPLCSAYTTEKSDWSCFCPQKAAPGSVWGSGPYTADSNICTAARHAGVITETGGMVRLTTVAGQASYSGSEANGVITRDWGSFAQSISFPKPSASALAACTTLPTGTEAQSCYCPGDASKKRDVWGTGPYTADSNICAAAFHAGVIGAAGGEVRVLRVPGLPSYSGSRAGGVTTGDWGAYAHSIVFDRNGG
ncbi:LCCL domain-containing protein [Vannielia sp.]|uniref:LCCL domain-containing protein n=1 Tax=Vannielia sp. TaxID=2813045 RepID=UPI0026113CFE|nr:LCCL domain-containing protein [Vannielia sp.]MDF1873208.1 LCCL domain-containing protein [Vannielia sp.]